MHLVAALGLTTVLAVGLAGLGGALGGRNAADRWVRGWTVAWWAIALTAEAWSPRAAVVVGSLVLTAGLVAAVRALRAELRTALAFGVGLAVGAPLWLLPPYFYDTLAYHLGLPWSWLANGSFATVPHDLFSHFPLAGQSVFLLPVAAGLPEAAAGLHWATFLVALATAARLARALGAGRWSWVAPVLLLACWHALWIATVAAVDILVVVAILAMAAQLVGEEGGALSRATGLGTGLGLALSAKYTAMVPAAAVLVVAAASFPAAAAAGGAVGAVSSSFFWIRNLVTTGNPFYPLFWALFGGKGWTAADDARYLGLVREGVNGLAGFPHAVARLIAPPDGLGWWAVVALPLVALALATRGERRRARARLGIACALMLAGWLLTSQTTRYALPLAALIAVLAAAGLGDLGRGAKAVGAAALVAAGLHGIVGFGGFAFGVLGVGRAWTDTEDWRHGVTVNDPLPAYRLCDTALPPEARILVVAEGRPWGCPRPHHTSSAYDRQLVQEVVEEAPSSREVWRRLRAAGFTHLLINWGEADRLGGPEFSVLRWSGDDVRARWRRFLDQFSLPVLERGGVEVRALAATRR